MSTPVKFSEAEVKLLLGKAGLSVKPINCGLDATRRPLRAVYIPGRFDYESPLTGETKSFTEGAFFIGARAPTDEINQIEFASPDSFLSRFKPGDPGVNIHLGEMARLTREAVTASGMIGKLRQAFREAEPTQVTRAVRGAFAKQHAIIG